MIFDLQGICTYTFFFFRFKQFASFRVCWPRPRPEDLNQAMSLNDMDWRCWAFGKENDGEQTLQKSSRRLFWDIFGCFVSLISKKIVGKTIFLKEKEFKMRLKAFNGVCSVARNPKCLTFILFWVFDRGSKYPASHSCTKDLYSRPCLVSPSETGPAERFSWDKIRQG